MSTGFVAQEDPRAPSLVARTFASLCQGALGILFVITGLAKAAHLQEFMGVLLASNTIHHEVLGAVAVMVFELTLGFFLLCGRRRRAALLFALAALFAFTAATFYFAHRGITDCGCFTGLAPISSLSTHLILLAGFVGLALLPLSRRRLPNWFEGQSREASLFNLAALACAIIACTLALPQVRSFRSMHSKPAVGDKLPAAPWLREPSGSGNENTNEGGLTLIFVRADCSHCLASLSALQQPVARSLAQGKRLLFVSNKASGDYAPLLRLHGIHAPLVQEESARLTNDFHVMRTPTAVTYRKGVVSAVAVGSTDVVAFVEANASLSKEIYASR